MALLGPEDSGVELASSCSLPNAKTAKTVADATVTMIQAFGKDRPFMPLPSYTNCYCGDRHFVPVADRGSVSRLRKVYSCDAIEAVRGAQVGFECEFHGTFFCE